MAKKQWCLPAPDLLVRMYHDAQVADRPDPSAYPLADQVLAPSYTMDVARKVWQMLAAGRFGLYHLTNAGECSWHEFAQAVFRLTGVKADLHPTTLAEFDAPAPRPPYSVLDNEGLKALGLDDMPHWEDALGRYLNDL